MFYINIYSSKLLRYEQKHNFKGSAVSGKVDAITYYGHVHAFQFKSSNLGRIKQLRVKERIRNSQAPA